MSLDTLGTMAVLVQRYNFSIPLAHNLLVLLKKMNQEKKDTNIKPLTEEVAKEIEKVDDGFVNPYVPNPNLEKEKVEKI